MTPWLALSLVLVTGATTSEPAPKTSAAPSQPRFEEIGAAAGVRFVHSTRKFTGHPKAEVLQMFTDGGAAAAAGDFDGDGDIDLFVTDSDTGKANHLMRNEFIPSGELRFRDVTEEVSSGGNSLAGGNDPASIVADALWFDYDNDGYRDLLVARFGTPLLYRGLGPSTGEPGAPWRFKEVSTAAGLDEFGNTIAVIAFDADRDGYLDLLFGNYFQPLNLLDLETSRVLPNNLDYADNGGGVTFWHNIPIENETTGGRGFRNVTEPAGFAAHTGWTLDVGHADLNSDGWQDVYLAGDYGTDRLFFNNGDGTFREVTEEALGGFDTRKGMNVDVGDYDRNGHLDVYVTNITDEYMRECNMLWHNTGDGTFLDLSRETGTCDTDWGWAGKFGDFDNDGWEDLFVVNGLRSAGEQNYIPILLEAILSPEMVFSDLHSYPDIGDMTWSGYQKQRLFRNLGDGTFRDVAAEAGVDNDLDGRGIAMADFDNDGLLDLYQTNANQPALLYRGASERAGNWVQLRLRGTRSNRDAIGARVLLTTDDGEVYLREVNGGNAYASASMTRLHFGIGAATRVIKLEVRWPSGSREIWVPTGDEGSSEGESVAPVTVLPVNEISLVVEGERKIRRVP